MAGLRPIFRWLALVTMAVWLGGFTFYSSFVLPILHETIGRFETGATVTREVAVKLNLAGVATLAVWWALAAAERREGSAAARRLRVALLATDSAVLVGLVWLHSVMAGRLDEGPMRGFYPMHRVYLWASTVQWALNLALLGVTVWLWTPPSAATDGAIAGPGSR